MARGYRGFRRNPNNIAKLPEDITTQIYASQYHSASWGYNSYVDAIDLTHVKKVVISYRYQVTFPSSGGRKNDYWDGSQHALIISPTRPSLTWTKYSFWESTSGDYTPVSINSSGTREIDVSDLKGLYYIGCGANNISPYDHSRVSNGSYWAYTYITNVHFE